MSRKRSAAFHAMLSFIAFLLAALLFGVILYAVFMGVP